MIMVSNIPRTTYLKMLRPPTRLRYGYSQTLAVYNSNVWPTTNINHPVKYNASTEVHVVLKKFASLHYSALQVSQTGKI